MCTLEQTLSSKIIWLRSGGAKEHYKLSDDASPNENDVRRKAQPSTKGCDTANYLALFKKTKS